MNLLDGDDSSQNGGNNATSTPSTHHRPPYYPPPLSDPYNMHNIAYPPPTFTIFHIIHITNHYHTQGILVVVLVKILKTFLYLITPT